MAADRQSNDWRVIPCSCSIDSQAGNRSVNGRHLTSDPCLRAITNSERSPVQVPRGEIRLASRCGRRFRLAREPSLPRIVSRVFCRSLL